MWPRRSAPASPGRGSHVWKRPATKQHGQVGPRRKSEAGPAGHEAAALPPSAAGSRRWPRVASPSAPAAAPRTRTQQRRSPWGAAGRGEPREAEMTRACAALVDAATGETPARRSWTRAPRRVQKRAKPGPRAAATFEKANRCDCHLQTGKRLPRTLRQRRRRRLTSTWRHAACFQPSGHADPPQWDVHTLGRPRRPDPARAGGSAEGRTVRVPRLRRRRRRRARVLPTAGDPQRVAKELGVKASAGSVWRPRGDGPFPVHSPHTVNDSLGAPRLVLDRAL